MRAMSNPAVVATSAADTAKKIYIPTSRCRKSPARYRRAINPKLTTAAMRPKLLRVRIDSAIPSNKVIKKTTKKLISPL